MTTTDDRVQRHLFGWSVADADAFAGRELTEDELERIGRGLEGSTIAEVFGDVVFAVAGAEDDEDG